MYNRYYKDYQSGADHHEMPDLAKHYNHILSAYKTGDSFSYFMLERIMAIMGICDWEYIRPVINAFFNAEGYDYRQNQWFDYSQMSMLYVLYQVSIYNKSANEEDIISLFSRESEDWTRRCKGLFHGRKSDIANAAKKYKRNVMNWYCSVYCSYAGDAVARNGDEKPVPVFYKLIDEAISEKDKELLYHLLDNISELVTDSVYIQTALGLIKYIMIQFSDEKKVKEFDDILLDRNGIYKDDLITLIGKVLSTANNCFNKEVDYFIRNDMVRLKFPGISRYRGEILNYNPSGEALSDLFTHKFGNFLVWSLLNEAIGECVYEILSVSVDSSNCDQWYDKAVRIIARDLFKVDL